MVNFSFDDLKIGYPLQGWPPRYCLYAYPAEFRSLVALQFVGDEIVEQRCSYDEWKSLSGSWRRRIGRSGNKTIIWLGIDISLLQSGNRELKDTTAVSLFVL